MGKYFTLFILFDRKRHFFFFFWWGDRWLMAVDSVPCQDFWAFGYGRLVCFTLNTEGSINFTVLSVPCTSINWTNLQQTITEVSVYATPTPELIYNFLCPPRHLFNLM